MTISPGTCVGPSFANESRDSPCVAVRRAYRESLEFGDFQEKQHFLKPASGITFETDGVITYTVQPEEDPE